jgi:hypothetical protein
MSPQLCRDRRARDRSRSANGITVIAIVANIKNVSNAGSSAEIRSAGRRKRLHIPQRLAARATKP